MFDMDFERLAGCRQSDRKYRPQPVENDTLVRCLKAARVAPSACNSQPWKFVVVDDRDLLTGLADAACGTGMNKFAYQAPVIIAVVLEKMNVTARIGSMLKNKDYSMMDLGMAVENLCLQAADLGLGTCIMGWFNEKKVASLLGVPRSKRIPLLITLGYPDAPTRDKVRKPLGEIYSMNRY